MVGGGVVVGGGMVGGGVVVEPAHDLLVGQFHGPVVAVPAR
jgi:hypothetical protein